MKVLYVGVYRDGTGWAQAAIDYILALDAAGVNVVCRPIRLNTHKAELPARILELEARESRGADYCIQHVLPHMMEPFGGFKKNIALFATETSDFNNTSWPHRINQMDAVWYMNHNQYNAIRDSGVTVQDVAWAPHASDTSRFTKTYEPLPAIKAVKDEGNFIFYTMGEMVRRKNLAALLKAFHLEFGPEEPVQLVIKTSKSGMDSAETFKHVTAFCESIKKGLKLYHRGDGSPALDEYKQEIVVTERLSATDMLRLHSSCDCFVQPSYGEAWSIPAFDAMGLGKTPIVTRCGGYPDYVTNDTGWLVNTHEEPVFGVDDSFIDLFTGKESWSAVDVAHLRHCMREAYEDNVVRKCKSEEGILRATNFSYSMVGQIMRGALETYESRQASRRSKNSSVGRPD